MVLDVILLEQISNSSDYKEVWIGRWKSDEEVIVKIYRDKSLAFREIYATSSIPAHIRPDILHSERIGDIYFIIEEKLEGRLLSELDVKEDLAYALGKTVALVHNYGVLHGDLHSKNIIVTEENHLKIIDWEFSCFLPKGRELENIPLDILSICMDLEEKYFNNFLEGYFANTIYSAQTIAKRINEITHRLGIKYVPRL